MLPVSLSTAVKLETTEFQATLQAAILTIACDRSECGGLQMQVPMREQMQMQMNFIRVISSVSASYSDSHQVVHSMPHQSSQITRAMKMPPPVAQWHTHQANGLLMT